MIAFVLSGGGSRGAFEAGALVALFERGIQPDIVVGTSAGAIKSCSVLPRGTSPGWLPSNRLRAFSVRANAAFDVGDLRGSRI